jgi:uncharacterized protein (DUF58 family)
MQTVDRKSTNKTMIFNLILLPVKIFRQVKIYFDELVLIIIGLFLFFVATNVQAGWLFIVIALIVSVMITGCISSIINTKKLAIERIFEEINSEDNTVTVNLKVSNRGRIPKFMIQVQDTFPTLYPNEKNPVLMINYIPSGGHACVSYKRKAYKRGVYEFTPVIIKSAGILGFFYIEKKIKAQNNKLVILPTFKKINTDLLKGMPDRRFSEGRSINIPGRSFDFSGLREYQPGMETRFIHWPSMAKTGQVLLKEFRETGSFFLAIAVDSQIASKMGEGRETSGEYVLKTAAGFIREAQKMGFNLHLHTCRDGQLLTDSGTTMLKGLLRLAQFSADSDCFIDNNIAEIIDGTPAKSLLVILKIMPFVNFQFIAKLKTKKIKTFVIFFDPLDFVVENEKQRPGKTETSYLEQVAELRNAGIRAFVYSPEKCAAPTDRAAEGQRACLNS